MYVSLCDFVCLGLLLLSLLGFCLVLFVCLFFLFMSVCVYVSLCDFVCLVLLLPFGLVFYLSFFFSSSIFSFSSEPCGWKGLGDLAGCWA